MEPSARLAAMVERLAQLYPRTLIDAVLADAEVKALERGGRSITVEDWDAVMDDQPIDGSGYRIVSSGFVTPLLMLVGLGSGWE